MRSTHYILLSVLLGSILLIAVPLVGGQEVKDSRYSPALQTKQPSKVVLISIAKAGNRLVAAGERGVIITSDDGGNTWKQASVPCDVTLTAVRFASPEIGWAVGHRGVVLKSEDGGKTWARQLEGEGVAKLALDAASARYGKIEIQSDAQEVPFNPGELVSQETAKEALVRNIKRMLTDGADKPFLNLFVENEQVAIAVGAYGMIVATEDGGRTWTSWMDRMENPSGLNLNAVSKVGNTIYLAGEQGLFFVSKDNGKQFKAITTPYIGTYFDLIALPTGEVVIAGQKGNAFRFDGKAFTKALNPSEAHLSALTLLSDGSLLFLNQAGEFSVSHDKGKTLERTDLTLPRTAGMVDAGNGSLLAVGLTGVVSVPIPNTAAKASQGGAR